MFSLEQIFLRRALSRMRFHLEQEDVASARAELESVVARFPKSVGGWSTLQHLVDHDTTTFEEWLDVRRRAAKAIPYSVELNDAAIRASLYLFLKVGDRRYLDEAMEFIEAFEDLLGASAETAVWRAACAQMTGDSSKVLESVAQAEAFLERSPDPRMQLQIGLCLASEPGHEERGVQMAEAAAERLKDANAYLILVAIVEDADPSRAQWFRARADQLAGTHRRTPERSNAVLDGFREQVRLERELQSSRRTNPS